MNATNVKLRSYERPDSEVIQVEATDFILYDLPPVDDDGEDKW